MAKEKLTTQDILALARKQGAVGGSGAASVPPAAESAPTQESGAEPQSAEGASEAPAEAAPAPKPAAAAPKSTADILAAARAQAAAKKSGAVSKDVPSGGGEPAAPKVVAAKAAPKSTAEILAAARAQKAAGTATATAPQKPKAAVAKSAAPSGNGDGDRPPVREMVRALHEGKPIGATAVKPKLPSRPPLPRRAEPEIPRRAFPGAAIAALAAILATPFAAGMALLAIIGGLWSLLAARFMMPNMVVELPSKFKVGPLSDFPAGTVSEKFKASRGVWIVHSDAYSGESIVYALASVCTHLGCTPNWLESEQKFKCPCHGSGFYISGINFEGPAPRPLERVGIRVAEDGMLEVDKSVKFQEELGQWADSKSYVAVG